MSDRPVVLGVNRTQDASICLMHGSELQWAIQKERLTRQKHHWGRLDDFRNIYLPRLPALERPVDVLVECYSADAEFGKLAAYERELAATLNLAPGCLRTRISHHLAHVYSVFYPSPIFRMNDDSSRDQATAFASLGLPCALNYFSFGITKRNWAGRQMRRTPGGASTMAICPTVRSDRLNPFHSMIWCGSIIR